MSNFITRIPVNLEAVTKLLPKGSHVYAVDLAGDSIELRWCNDDVETGYTFFLDWPLDLLKKRKLPKGATEKERRQTDASVAAAKVEAPASPRKPSRD